MTRRASLLKPILLAVFLIAAMAAARVFHLGDRIGELREWILSLGSLGSASMGARVVLVAAGTGLKTLNNVIPPYPTRSDAVRQTASLFYVNNFSPRLKKWLVRWFKWRR